MNILNMNNVRCINNDVTFGQVAKSDGNLYVKKIFLYLFRQ